MQRYSRDTIPLRGGISKTVIAGTFRRRAEATIRRAVSAIGRADLTIWRAEVAMWFFDVKTRDYISFERK